MNTVNNKNQKNLHNSIYSLWNQFFSELFFTLSFRFYEKQINLNQYIISLSNLNENIIALYLRKNYYIPVKNVMTFSLLNSSWCNFLKE